MRSLQNSGDGGLTQTTINAIDRKEVFPSCTCHFRLKRCQQCQGEQCQPCSSTTLMKGSANIWWLSEVSALPKHKVYPLRTAVVMNIRFGFKQVQGFWCEWYCDGVGLVGTQGCMDAGRFDVGVGVVVGG